MSVDKIPDRQERASYSIDEFCERHGISRSFWYTLKRVGSAPDVTLLNNKNDGLHRRRAALAAPARASA